LTRVPPSTPLRELARGAAWLVGLSAAIQLASAALGPSPLAAALAGAVIADLGAARAGVAWIRAGEQDAPDLRRRVALRIAHGAGLGALAAALTLAVALALGWASVEVGRPSIGFALTLLRTVAAAIRDEIVLTAIPFAAAARAGVAPPFALAFAALAHGASLALAPDAGAAAIAIAVAAGALSAAAFWRHGGLWASVAAAAGFHLLAGAAFRGALLDVTWTGSTLVLGARASGPAAWLSAAVLVALAGAALRRPTRAAS
jgi:hypothetical protein